jgi:carbon monoxide dehydrogenase subunit G
VKLERTIEIARSPEEVYAFLADPANLPAWQGPVESVEWRGGEASAEDRFQEQRTFLGRHVASDVEVVAADRAREFSVRAAAGPVEVTARHYLSRAGEGTLVRVEVEAAKVPRLVAGVAARAARKQAEDDLARLKALLEGPSSRSRPPQRS